MWSESTYSANAKKIILRGIMPSKKNIKECKELLGKHQSSKNLSAMLASSDGHTDSGIPHRELSELPAKRTAFVQKMRERIIRHHANKAQIERHNKIRTTLEQQGLSTHASKIKLFPTASKTQKGNFAEIFLAEYLAESTNATLPIYRLRYNPNIEQAMKGDDVLLFDLDATPVQIIVGESKFRKSPSKKSVDDMIIGLEKSISNGIPASLQFVADRLFESGENELGDRVLNCAILFMNNKLDIGYAGILMSNHNASNHINKHGNSTMRRIVFISCRLEEPEDMVDDCFKDIEDSI